MKQLLDAQLNLSNYVCCQSPFASGLHKRLAVLQRVYAAVSHKCHDLNNLEEEFKNESDDESAEEEGTNALVELGVKTGLSLLFNLLKENLVADEVLKTALEVTLSLPELSLANESYISQLGRSSLEQIWSYLKKIVLEGPFDKPIVKIACELLLSIAIQRGKLRYILDWILLVIFDNPTSIAWSVVNKFLHHLSGDQESEIPLLDVDGCIPANVGGRLILDKIAYVAECYAEQTNLYPIK